MLTINGWVYNGFVHTDIIKGHIKVKKQKPPAKRVSSEELTYLANTFQVTGHHVGSPSMLGLESMKLKKARSCL